MHFQQQVFAPSLIKKNAICYTPLHPPQAQTSEAAEEEAQAAKKGHFANPYGPVPQ
jgi:hypothetical protein